MTCTRKDFPTGGGTPLLATHMYSPDDFSLTFRNSSQLAPATEGKDTKNQFNYWVISYLITPFAALGFEVPGDVRLGRAFGSAFQPD